MKKYISVLLFCLAVLDGRCRGDVVLDTNDYVYTFTFPDESVSPVGGFSVWATASGQYLTVAPDGDGNWQMMGLAAGPYVPGVPLTVDSGVGTPLDYFVDDAGTFVYGDMGSGTYAFHADGTFDFTAPPPPPSAPTIADPSGIADLGSTAFVAVSTFVVAVLLFWILLKIVKGLRVRRGIA